MNGTIAGDKVVDGVALRVTSPLAWLALGVAAAAALGLYAPVVAGMAAEWAEFPSLSHGFAVPVIAGLLGSGGTCCASALRARSSASAQTPRSSMLVPGSLARAVRRTAVAALALSSVLFLMAEVAVRPGSASPTCFS